ncbi:HlyD family secretion protein [Rhodoligotrophos appendicifer]|uniref:HlyD family secretion protein n=1 Tax=Rhodoligotrophos appendicifer TaxID=987056 RepID=UPI001FE60029|nr:HlyD family efflux transporter periplasmic adaptor subunit [Rhodoligotrophos appendicifer]
MMHHGSDHSGLSALRTGRIALLLMAILGVVSFSGTPTTHAQEANFKQRLQELWQRFGGDRLPRDVASSNGRIEAEQILVSAKFAGRIAELLVEEGQTVEAGSVVGRMDTSELEAQLKGAEAQVRRSERAIAESEAAIAQRQSELLLTQQEFRRTETLQSRGYATQQELDNRRSRLNVAEAGERAAHASYDEAQAGADVARAEVARIRSLLDDAVLTAPRRGRVEYRLAHAGEVVAAGAPVVTLLDLSDVYMTIFLPAYAAGRLALGDEARIVLDPAPDYVIPATISFVAAGAQFTPKSVETADEREKLMFRVKLQLSSALLKQYESRVKIGVRGIAYVRTSQAATWPEKLAVKLPQ